MSGNERFLSSRQITLLILGFAIGGGILTLPSLAAEVLGASGWLLVLALGLLYMGSAWIAARLAAKFPEERSSIQPPSAGQRVWTPVQPGLYCPPFSGHSGEHPDSPGAGQYLAPAWSARLVRSGSYLLVLAYGATRPVDQIAQVNELLIEIALLIGLFVALTAFQHFEPLHLRPLLSRDQINLDKIRAVDRDDLFLRQYSGGEHGGSLHRQPWQVTKATLKASLVITMVYSFFTATTIGVFGYKETIELSWVALELAKSVNAQAVILERLDLVLIVSWISALFTTGLIACYLVGAALGRLFRVRKEAAFIWGLAPVAYYLSTKLKNYFVWSQASFYVAVLSLVITFLGYPLLYLLSLVKGKHRV